MRRALVVDDELGMRELVALLLRHLRLDPVQMATAPAALVHLQQDNDFAVIFVDMQMPGMSGAEFVSQVKALYPSIPVIVMTVQPQSDLIQAALNLGAEVQMQYPYILAHLMHALEAVDLL